MGIKVDNYTDIPENIKRVRGVVAEAAIKSGRAPEEIILVAASKTKPAGMIKEAIAAGVDAVGENRVQEMLEKAAGGAFIGAPLHFIGTLQSNKAGKVVGACDLIESVGSRALLELIGRKAVSLGIVQNVLIEVNIAGEASKHGIVPEEVLEFAEQVIQLPSIAVHGLMTMGPADATESQRRNYFEKMAQLHQDLNKIAQARFLSMGMSGDYEAAIECGANIVRIGRGIFG